MTPEPLSDEELTKIQERVDKATPGPWTALADSSRGKCAGIFAPVPADEPDYYDERGVSIVVTDDGVYPPEADDAQFIAHARTDVPALLAEVRRLRAELAIVRANPHPMGVIAASVAGQIIKRTRK